MSVIVVISQVPDTEAVIKPDSANSAKINEDEIKFVLNPYDEYAVEEALVIADNLDMETIAVCIGPSRAETAIRSALAMGINSAIFISDEEAVNADSVSRGKIIAAAVKDLNAKIILTGKETIDWNDDSMAAILAEELDFPHVTYASKIEIENDTITVSRDIEGGSLEINSSFPVVISCQKGLNDPRYPNLIAIKRSKKKEIKAINLTDLGIELNEPKTKIVNLKTLPPRAEGIKVSGEPEEVVSQCVDWMSNNAKII
ncbi:MAG: electron transfer flavoprotein subunit beta/FixA family protein [Calditrichia bacterium]|nr:electron transfer flavoprotein subunit beta/FixA family protein [Calditrichia bacterium]